MPETVASGPTRAKRLPRPEVSHRFGGGSARFTSCPFGWARRELPRSRPTMSPTRSSNMPCRRLDDPRERRQTLSRDPCRDSRACARRAPCPGSNPAHEKDMPAPEPRCRRSARPRLQAYLQRATVLLSWTCQRPRRTSHLHSAPFHSSETPRRPDSNSIARHPNHSSPSMPPSQNIGSCSGIRSHLGLE